MFKVGDEVKCVDVEVHTWHTKIELDGVIGQFRTF